MANIPSPEQKQRAHHLADTKACPHCGNAITLLDALCMVRGHGVRYMVKVRYENGSDGWLYEDEFNPQFMELVDHLSQSSKSACPS